MTFQRMSLSFRQYVYSTTFENRGYHHHIHTNYYQIGQKAKISFKFELIIFIDRALHLVERGKSFQEKILETTNEERAKHGVGALQWDNGLENTATQWAKHLAAEDKFYHSNAGDKG